MCREECLYESFELSAGVNDLPPTLNKDDQQLPLILTLTMKCWSEILIYFVLQYWWVYYEYVISRFSSILLLLSLFKQSRYEAHRMLRCLQQRLHCLQQHPECWQGEVACSPDCESPPCAWLLHNWARVTRGWTGLTRLSSHWSCSSDTPLPPDYTWTRDLAEWDETSPHWSRPAKKIWLK